MKTLSLTLFAISIGLLTISLHAANSVTPQEQFTQAITYLEGKGTPRDVPKALSLLTEAANAGSPEAANRLGFLYDTGTEVTADKATARMWYEKAAASGLAKAQFNLAKLILSDKTEAAENTRVVELLTQASEQDLLPAQLVLGEVYYFGEIGQAQDYKKAYPLFLAAANAGNAVAQNYVGIMTRYGEGVKLNRELGVSWFKKAADQGLAKAQAALGHHYLTGTGIKLDKVEAVKYLMLSAEQNEITGKQTLEGLTANLDPSIIAEATERAEIFQEELKKKKANNP